MKQGFKNTQQQRERRINALYRFTFKKKSSLQSLQEYGAYLDRKKQEVETLSKRLSGAHALSTAAGNQLAFVNSLLYEIDQYWHEAMQADGKKRLEKRKGKKKDRRNQFGKEAKETKNV